MGLILQIQCVMDGTPVGPYIRLLSYWSAFDVAFDSLVDDYVNIVTNTSNYVNYSMRLKRPLRMGLTFSLICS